MNDRQSIEGEIYNKESIWNGNSRMQVDIWVLTAMLF